MRPDLALDPDLLEAAAVRAAALAGDLGALTRKAGFLPHADAADLAGVLEQACVQTAQAAEAVLRAAREAREADAAAGSAFTW